MEFNAYEALGIEEPTAEGANEPEAAEPAETGETAQEVAAPAAEEAEEAENEAETAEAEEPEGEAEAEPKKEQSREERAENARRRRQQEQEAAIQRAVEKKEAELRAHFNKVIEAAGLKDPFNEQKPVSGIEELEAYTKSLGQKRLEKELREGRLTQEGLTTAIENSTSMQAVRRLTAEKEAAEAEKREQKIQGQLKEIEKLDPNIKTVSDLLNMEHAEEFRQYVNKGLDFVEAYKLVNLEKIQSNAVAAAKREVLNSEAGRKHLKPTPQRGVTQMKSVPPEVMSMYRMLNPNATDAEIQAHYNKNSKQ